VISRIDDSRSAIYGAGPRVLTGMAGLEIFVNRKVKVFSTA
jgi:hypothetical protein